MTPCVVLFFTWEVFIVKWNFLDALRKPLLETHMLSVKPVSRTVQGYFLVDSALSSLLVSTAFWFFLYSHTTADIKQGGDYAKASEPSSVQGNLLSADNPIDESQHCKKLTRMRLLQYNAMMFQCKGSSYMSCKCLTKLPLTKFLQISQINKQSRISKQWNSSSKDQISGWKGAYPNYDCNTWPWSSYCSSF